MDVISIDGRYKYDDEVHLAYGDGALNSIMFDLQCCSDVSTVIAHCHEGKLLYSFIKNKLSKKFYFDFLESLFRDGAFTFATPTQLDVNWLNKLFVYQLTDYSCHRIGKLLLKYRVFDCLPLFSSYGTYVPSEYEDDDQEYWDLPMLLRKNIGKGDIFRVRFQIAFSDIEQMRDTDVYLDPGMDCYLTPVNYAAVYCDEPNRIRMTGLLFKSGFIDYRTTNSYRRVCRPLSCVETAVFGTDEALMKVLLKVKDTHFHHNALCILDSLPMQRHVISHRCTNAVRLMLTADYSLDEKTEMCGVIKDAEIHVAPILRPILMEFVREHEERDKRALMSAIFNDMPSIDHVPWSGLAKDRLFGNSGLMRNVADFL